MIVAYIDAYRDRFGVEPICAVLSEHGGTIAPSTYYARTKTPVTDAELQEAYLVNALVDLHGPTGVSTGFASCGMRPAALVCRWVVTRSAG